MSLYKSTLPTVLLIENDPQLEEFFVRMIVNCGYEVLVIRDENELHTLNDSEFCSFHAVLVDDLVNPLRFFQNYRQRYVDLNLKKAPVLLVTSGDEDFNPDVVNNTFFIARKVNFNLSALTDKLEEAVNLSI